MTVEQLLGMRVIAPLCPTTAPLYCSTIPWLVALKTRLRPLYP